MKATADKIGFVGIPGLSTDSDGMDIEVNVASAWNPLRPLISANLKAAGS